MKNNQAVLLVGTGQMGIEYAKVLKQMGKSFVAVGRSESSTDKFKKETGFTAFSGGIDKWVNEVYLDIAIVAVSEEELGRATLKLLKNGFSSILVEKPGGIDAKQIRQVAKAAISKKAEIFVGYNRRFYASVAKLKKLIKEDGGILSFNFEFTEWSHIIEKLEKGKGVKENWFLHNSTHVIDLAFFLGGKPAKISAYTSGSLSWHSSGSIYVGSGISKTGALFSYQANWQAPGRWGIETLTRKHRFILRPLEKLQVQNIGSIKVEEVEITDQLDIKFKPGLYRQVESFLGDKHNLCSIQEQVYNLDFYKKILDN